MTPLTSSAQDYSPLCPMGNLGLFAYGALKNIDTTVFHEIVRWQPIKADGSQSDNWVN